MKISAVVSLVVFATIATACIPAMAAGGVGEVGGDGSANGGAPAGSTAPLGGGGSSFAAPAGTDTGPGIVGNLETLARNRPAPNTAIVGSPTVVPANPAGVGSAAPAAPPPPVVRKGN
jgi:hypothetical protein